MVCLAFEELCHYLELLLSSRINTISQFQVEGPLEHNGSKMVYFMFGPL